MKVKCPECGHEFEIEPIIPVTSDKPAIVETDIGSERLTPIEIDVKSLLYCGPYKEIHLSCGHIIRCEFSQFYKGQKVYCMECNRRVEVVKCIDSVTGREHDRL